jgi:hypothetical protein
MTPMTDEHRDLAPEVRARTVLATADRVEVTIDGADEHGSVSFLAYGSEIFLVRSCTSDVEGAAVRMVCQGPVQGLGVLELLGRCDAPLTAAELPALLPPLARHGHQLHAAAQVVPVELGEVRLLVPFRVGGRSMRVVTVLTDRFESAHPDTWLSATTRLGHHLEERHQAELDALVVRHLDRRPAAVVVRSLSRESMRLTCLYDDGVSELTVDYDRPLTEVGELTDWLRQFARS